MTREKARKIRKIATFLYFAIGVPCVMSIFACLLSSMAWYKKVLSISAILVIYLLVIAIQMMVMNHQYLRYCMFAEYEIFVDKNARLSLSANATYTWHAKLFFAHLHMGKTDQCKEDMKRMEKVLPKLKDKQKLLVLCDQVNLAYETGAKDYAKRLEELTEKWKEYNDGTGKGKDKVLARDMTNYLIRAHMREEEKWEELIEFLKVQNCLNTFTQVIRCYQMGTCYRKLNDLPNAKANFQLVVAKGGDTKYVKRAQEYLDQMTEVSTEGANPLISL